MNFTSKKYPRLLLATVLVTGVSLPAVDAMAGSATSNMPVTATITTSCTLSAGTLAFGTYDPIVANAATPLDATALLTSTCTSGATATISLAEGANAAGGSTPTVPLRQLASAANRLAYFLYSDSGRTTVWNNTGVATPTGTGAGVTNTVYGRIPAGQNKPAGSYTDTVVATINF